MRFFPQDCPFCSTAYGLPTPQTPIIQSGVKLFQHSFQILPGVTGVAGPPPPPGCRRRRWYRRHRPPSGPRSMMWSAHLITSRLCSMTTTVFPRPPAAGAPPAASPRRRCGGRWWARPEYRWCCGGALAQLRGQLHPLGLAAGEGGGCLAHLDIAEPYVAQGLHPAGDLGNGLEELLPLLGGHLQHLVDVLALVADLQGPPPGCIACPCRPRRGRRYPGGSGISILMRPSPEQASHRPPRTLKLNRPEP